MSYPFDGSLERRIEKIRELANDSNLQPEEKVLIEQAIEDMKHRCNVVFRDRVTGEIVHDRRTHQDQGC